MSAPRTLFPLIVSTSPAARSNISASFSSCTSVPPLVDPETPRDPRGYAQCMACTLRTKLSRLQEPRPPSVYNCRRQAHVALATKLLSSSEPTRQPPIYRVKLRLILQLVERRGASTAARSEETSLFRQTRSHVSGLHAVTLSAGDTAVPGAQLSSGYESGYDAHYVAYLQRDLYGARKVILSIIRPNLVFFLMFRCAARRALTRLRHLVSASARARLGGACNGRRLISP